MLILTFMCLYSALNAADIEKPNSYTVILPDGFIYKSTGTIDSEMGYFLNPQLGIKINVEVGLMAGVNFIDNRDKENDHTIIKITNTSFPKLISASFFQKGLKNCGHMETSVKNEDELLSILKFLNSFTFKT